MNEITRPCIHSFIRSFVHDLMAAVVLASGAVPRDDLADALVVTVVGLQGAGALAGPAAGAGAVARVAQTLGLARPTVDHAARELVAGQELTGIRLVGCRREHNRGEIDEPREGFGAGGGGAC